MTNQEAIESLRENYCCNRVVCELHGVDLCQKEKCEIWMAISALKNSIPLDWIDEYCKRFDVNKYDEPFSDEAMHDISYCRDVQIRGAITRMIMTWRKEQER